MNRKKKKVFVSCALMLFPNVGPEKYGCNAMNASFGPMKRARQDSLLCHNNCDSD